MELTKDELEVLRTVLSEYVEAGGETNRMPQAESLLEKVKEELAK